MFVEAPVLPVERTSRLAENPRPQNDGGNRRMNYRLATVLPLQVRVLSEHGDLGEPEEALSADISISGLSFLLEDPIPPCSLLDITITDLPYMDELSIPADVVRCVKIQKDNGDMAYLIGADFKAYINRQLRTELQRSVTVLHRMKEHKALPFC